MVTAQSGSHGGTAQHKQVGCGPSPPACGQIGNDSPVTDMSAPRRGRADGRWKMGGMRPLISTTDLAAALAGPGGDRPVVLDVRWRLAGPPRPRSYPQGPVPGPALPAPDPPAPAEAGGGGR